MTKMSLGVVRGTRAALAAWREAAAETRAKFDRDEPERPPAGRPVENEPASVKPDVPPDNLRTLGGTGITYIGSEREAPDDQLVDRPAPARTSTWRLALVLVLPVVLAALGAYVVAAEQDEVYAARSEVIFDLRDQSWSGAERFLSTQAVVVQSRTLLTPIARQFQIPVQDLEENLSVAPVDDSGVLRIEWQDSDGFRALDVVRAVTDRYLTMLRQFEQREGGSHRLLTPAFVLDDPVAPTPLRAALIGAAAGLVLAIAGLFLRYQTWSSP